MSQDRSLDEFTGGTDTTDSDSGSEAEGDDPTETTIDVTFAWTNDRAECAACGEYVERRWHSEAGLVCESCKHW